MYKKDIELIVKYDSKLLEYLYTNLGKSKKETKSYLVHGNVYVNNVNTTKYDYNVYKNQRIVIKQTKNTNRKLNILYEDDYLIAIDKPNGLLSIATNKNDTTAYKWVREYLINNNPNMKVFVIHRLDKDTSGVLLFAKEERIKNMLQNDWDNNIKLREYTAVVCGEVERERDTITSYLKENDSFIVYSTDSKDGKKAITKYEKIKSNKDYSLLRINLLTGRKNQIRVHMKDIDHPVIGDKKYGNNQNPIGRLGLHANKIKLIHPIDNKLITIDSKVPYEFTELLN